MNNKLFSVNFTMSNALIHASILLLFISFIYTNIISHYILCYLLLLYLSVVLYLQRCRPITIAPCNETTIPEPLNNLLAVQNIYQQNTISLIASESIPWPSVRCAENATLLSTKYAEGYPGKRYYAGCDIFDKIENLAIDRCKLAFGCDYVNIQPLSGSNANLAVYLALLKPGDTILGMDLKSGGHLTHGSKVSLSGKWFVSRSYSVTPEYKLDYDEIHRIAIKCQPKIIIAGCSSYPRQLDLKKFRAIADEVGAYLMADIAHVAGLIVGGVYPNPFPEADIVTSTTHKTLRGPRGGLIMTNNPELAVKINAAVFPGLQGGPFPHVIAGKAAMFLEDYTEYAQQLIKNTEALGYGIKSQGIPFIGDFDDKFTDTHIILIDVSNFGGGIIIEKLLLEAGIICNRNAIPHDPRGPRDPSGIRLGGTVITNRGLNEHECYNLGVKIGKLITMPDKLAEITIYIQELCKKYPLS